LVSFGPVSPEFTYQVEMCRPTVDASQYIVMVCMQYASVAD